MVNRTPLERPRCLQGKCIALKVPKNAIIFN